MCRLWAAKRIAREIARMDTIVVGDDEAGVGNGRERMVQQETCQAGLASC